MLQRSQQKWMLFGCLLLLYASWGSGFLGIKFALEYFPGVMLSGIRMTTGGIILLAFTFFRGEKARITMEDIKVNAILGFYLVLIASGFLCKGQESVPSGTAALIYGSAPIWMVLYGWLFMGEKKPTIIQFFGLILGFTSLMVLNFYQGAQGDVSVLGVVFILLSTFGWVYGSFVSKRYPSNQKFSVVRSTGLIMFIGGVETLLLSALIGERVEISSILNWEIFWAMAYVIIFSSIVGYVSYLWLLYNARPAVAISYEYVNPVIAIYLGWLLAGENLDTVVMATCFTLVTSVFFIISHDRH